MKNAAAFEATYSDFRLIKGRKVVQFVFEVPLEKADTALNALGGMPNPAAEVWCAVARLDPTKIGASPLSPHAPEGEVAGPSTLAAEPSSTTSARRRGAPSPENRMKTRAAILCTQPVFWRFLQETYGSRFPAITVSDEESAAYIVRYLCHATSRAEILPGTEQGELWEKIYTRFVCWENDLEEPAA